MENFASLHKILSLICQKQGLDFFQMLVDLIFASSLLKGEDVKTAGVATHYVLSESLPQLQEELGKLKEKNMDTVNGVISRFARSVDSEKSILVLEKELISRVFSLPTVENIFTALNKEKSLKHS